MTDSFTNLYCHIVFSTKNRAPLITERIDATLHGYVNGIIRNFGERVGFRYAASI